METASGENVEEAHCPRSGPRSGPPMSTKGQLDVEIALDSTKLGVVGDVCPPAAMTDRTGTKAVRGSVVPG